MMTPHDPRWQEFIQYMEGRNGCDFKGSGEDFTFTCDNTANRPIARRILGAMGLSSVEVEQTLGYFHAYGGHCDCEIIFNVESSWRAAMGRVRVRRGKNP